MTHLRIAFGVGIFAAASFAGSLEPGEVQGDPDYFTTNTYTQSAPPGSGDGPLATMTVSFSTSTFSGTLTSYVYANPDGGLTFGYVVSNDEDSTDGIEDTNFNFPGYAGWTISDAGSREVDGSVEASLLDRTNSGAPGALWDGDGDGNIQPGTSGAEFWYVVPNATVWSTGVMLIQDGNQVDVAAFIPAPEPGTLALIGGALVVLGAARRRRKRQLAS